MPVDAMFEIGSVTKQFTAVAVLQLRDQGKLSLDDDITRWLPDFDTRGHRVTLRHLLGHTAGIADFTEAPEFGHLSTNIRLPAIRPTRCSSGSRPSSPRARCRSTTIPASGFLGSSSSGRVG
jgi:CubicO group peptidase (beta-lactamase class C family)